MRRLALLLSLLVVLGFVAAGCGGGGGGGIDQKGPGGGTTTSGGGDQTASGEVPESADFVPADAPGYVWLDTDSDSSQWKAADKLLQKFPGRAELLESIRKQLAEDDVDYERDVKPALGPEVGLGILKFQGETGNVVALTQPRDEAALERLLAKAADDDPTVRRTIDEWVAVSDVQAAVDAAAAAHEGQSLADGKAAKEAFGGLADDALAKFFVSGESISGLLKRVNRTGTQPPADTGLEWVAGAVEAKDDGLGFRILTESKTATDVPAYEPKLPEVVPTGVLAYVSFSGAGKSVDQLLKNPALRQYLDQLEQSIGVTIEELAPLLRGEGALFVRSGLPLPEVALVLTVEDEEEAQATADRIATRLAQGAPITSTTVDGVTLKQVRAGQVAVYYGTFDGKLVVTSATATVSALRDDGPKFKDDPIFEEAKDGAGMGDETSGFVYVNLKDAIALAVSFAESNNQKLPPGAAENLGALRSLLFHSRVDGRRSNTVGFLGIE